jgi:hypothetical protein
MQSLHTITHGAYTRKNHSICSLNDFGIGADDDLHTTIRVLQGFGDGVQITHSVIDNGN